MQLPLNIVAHGSESLQQQITQQIRCLIHDGRLAPGTRMPATRELASDLGVSRNTVIGAFQRLIAEGCLESREPVGTFVAQRIIVDLKDKIMSAGIATELHVSATASAPAVNTAVKDEAVSAMTMLGFSPAPVAKVVTAILTEQPDLAVELVVKEALKRIK